MTLSEFERIKSKIVKAKDSANRARGALDRIKEQWLEYNIHSEEECREAITALSESINADEKKKTILMDKLEQITDWSAI